MSEGETESRISRLRIKISLRLSSWPPLHREREEIERVF